jgi:hypothetical protein
MRLSGRTRLTERSKFDVLGVALLVCVDEYQVERPGPFFDQIREAGGGGPFK